MPTKDGTKLFKTDINKIKKRQLDYINYISIMLNEKTKYILQNIEVPLLLDFNIEYYTDLLTKLEITLLENELGFLNKVGQTWLKN